MKRTFTFEHLLYLIALVLAFAFRFIGLGDVPLSEFEANWAMQAYQLAGGESFAMGGQATYVVLTGVLFSFFGSSVFLARLLPALVGSLLSALPWFARERMGRTTMLILAFGLALDPSLVAASRLAGGPVLALGIVLGLIVAWLTQRPVWMGVLFGLGLLSGMSFWFGFISLIVAALILRIFSSESIRIESSRLRQMALPAAITIFFVGTNFMRFPGGLSALGGGLADFFAGWAQPSGVFVGQVLFSLGVYQPLALVVMLVVFFLRLFERQVRSSILLLWVITALFLVIAYPARQLHDLVWVLLPVWAVAAQGLAQYIKSFDLRDPVAGGQALLTFVFLVFAWLDLSYIVAHALSGEELNFRLLIAAVVIALAIVSTILIGFGWTFSSALRGFSWGLIAFFTFYFVGTAWTASHLRERLVYELLQPNPVAGVNDAFYETITWLSEHAEGHDLAIELVYLDNSATLKWLLRALPNARYAEQLAPGELPAVVIANSEMDNVFLQTSYRGQSFSIKKYRGWDTTFPPDILRWLVWRESISYQDDAIIWVRTDILPDASPFSGLELTP